MLKPGRADSVSLPICGWALAIRLHHVRVDCLYFASFCTAEFIKIGDNPLGIPGGNDLLGYSKSKHFATCTIAKYQAIFLQLVASHLIHCFVELIRNCHVGAELFSTG